MNAHTRHMLEYLLKLGHTHVTLVRTGAHAQVSISELLDANHG